MHGRNRNVCMDSDLRSWPWVNQRIPDHKPSALFSSSRLPQPYGHLEFRKMRQRRRNSTHYMPPLKVRGGAYIKFYTESRSGIRRGKKKWIKKKAAEDGVRAPRRDG